jgi:putative beta-lysine N-acetyltransferase
MPTDADIYVDERNCRVKLLDCGSDPTATAAAAVELAESRGLTKIWGFVSPVDWVSLSQVGFTREGILDGYFDDGPGIGVARYLSGDRARSKHTAMEDAIVEQACAKQGQWQPELPERFVVRPATEADAGEISLVLQQVFVTYPTPIDSAEAILNAMANNVFFTLVEYDSQIVSVASTDVDPVHLVAEMTDCATLPDFRGKGLMRYLLSVMEDAMRAKGLRSVFTLARATSIAMNTAFARLDYAYKGRFINNCYIAGDWEDMNLWVKILS